MKRKLRLSAAILLVMAALSIGSCADAVAPLADEPANVPATPTDDTEDLTGKPIRIGGVISLPATAEADTDTGTGTGTGVGTGTGTDTGIGASGSAGTRAAATDSDFPKEGSTITIFCFVPEAASASSIIVSPAAHANYTYKGGSWQLTDPNAPLCWQHGTFRHYFAAVSPAVDDTEADFGAKAKVMVGRSESSSETGNISSISFDPAFNLPAMWTDELYTAWSRIRSTGIGGKCVYGEAPKASATISLELCRPLVSIDVISTSTQVMLRNAPATTKTEALGNPVTRTMQMLSQGGMKHSAYTLPYKQVSGETTTSINISFITDAGISASSVSQTGLQAGKRVKIIETKEDMTVMENTAGGLGDALKSADTSKKKIVIGGKINDTDIDTLKTFISNNSITDVAIVADGVTSIGGSAFKGCSSLTSISLPEGVTSIEYNAFYGCSSLTSISLPEGVTSIGANAFYGCPLKSISLPEGVTSIENSVFYGCSSLTSISLPDGVTSIGKYAFQKCSSLTNISLPKGVTSIGESAFSECTALTSISLPEGVTSIKMEAFIGCTSLTNISLPKGVTSIESGAFAGCPLKSISLPEGVTSIGIFAFYECSSLEEISLSGLNDQLEPALPTLDDNDAFSGTKLTTLFLRDIPPEIFDSANYTSWGGITWKSIHYGYNGPDDDLYHTDAAYYSGHWFAPTPTP